jgi:catechol 2,3-dioxygenase-like lactoylglutathione lyase family enzyme
VPATAVYHVGILVDDIGAAMTRLTDVLGVTFREPHTFQVILESDGTSRPSEVVASYSNEGPPFVELLQSQDDDGPFGRVHGEGLHHVALWEKSIEDRLRKLEAKHVRVETLIRDGDGRLIAAYGLDDTVGMRIEWCLHEPSLPGYTPDMPGTVQ